MNQTQILSPENCITMHDVRKGVDATDAQLVALLVQRFAYMDAAARIKPDRSAIRDEDRKAQVLSHVRAAADAAKLPVAPIENIWEMLVEASIAYEMQEWERLQAEGLPAANAVPRSKL